MWYALRKLHKIFEKQWGSIHFNDSSLIMKTVRVSRSKKRGEVWHTNTEMDGRQMKKNVEEQKRSDEAVHVSWNEKKWRASEQKRRWVLSGLPSPWIYCHTTVTGSMVEAPFALNKRPQKNLLTGHASRWGEAETCLSLCLIYCILILLLFWIKVFVDRDLLILSQMCLCNCPYVKVLNEVDWT